MRKLASLFVFALVFGSSAVAGADVPPEPEPKQDLPAESNDDAAKKTEESKGCSVVADDHAGDSATLGFGALVLLISGFGLRRRG